MNQQAISGTGSSNVTVDFTRLEKEYLLQIGSWFWIVYLTDEAREALSSRLSRLIANGKLEPDDDMDSTWSITCIGSIREHPEPISLEQYLAELEARPEKNG